MAATSWFRRNQKKLLGVLVVFLMLIWGIGPAAEYIIPKPGVGEILGQKITQDQFSNTATRWSRIFFRDSKEPVAQQVWRQMALIGQAENMGIVITKDELAQEIRNFFPVDPRIFEDKEGFRRLIGNVFHLTEPQFEQTIKEYLLSRKLQYLLKSSVKVTRNEAFQRYIKENEQVKIKYAALSARNFIRRVEIKEDEIKSFYDKYKENYPDVAEGIWGYKEPEKVKVEYIIAKSDEVEKQINITDEEMRKYYEEKKALMFKKESVEKPDETSVSEFKPYDEVKTQIKNNMLLRERETMLNKRIADVDNDIYENIDKEGFISFAKLAEKYGLSHVVATNRNNGTNYFTKEELREVFIDLPQFPQQVFEREVNDPSTPISSAEGKLIFRVIEKVEPLIPPYKVIHDKVAEDLRYEKAFEETEEFAKKCLEKVNQTSFEEGIKFIENETGKLAIVETKYVCRPGIFGEGDDTEVLEPEKAKIAETAFGLKVGTSAIAVENRGEKTCYVITLADRKRVDPKEFEEKKDEIMQQYLMEKQFAFSTEWESWIGTKTQLGKSKS
ncbi:parvulin-like peptidyl-prolyl isomerase [Candidatus Scalindua japonica]|uniref:Parvulin-like peptidyl-prolyl isomerase n=1 Tax=Candidatus Scalindua japonica TaxID=1284222 RepID=A0A286U0X5_9BACT|nr:SurA N-terminal domain-containing protein [Candidatus Scalindua japonica]GAX61766.1 parvulin-like peptidyl-prolyl isomerase [Candidatus Scalindua japonica]